MVSLLMVTLECASSYIGETLIEGNPEGSQPAIAGLTP